ncbi:hypothetical protein ACP2AV_13950 [Aliiroseovarius sp. PTFE2010]|uniref:hypothetical protein n=1 Tax=Aliiroseovarius sp. PTFE2010 TaxID=3417190 RepID=UPI003CEACDE6
MSQSARGIGVVLVTIAASLAVFAAMQLAAVAKAGWVFEYPLDDPYIHLAIGEQIAAGGYGINPGEYASAASSALYPLLLAPMADWQLAPLVWNMVGLVAAAWLFARIMIESGFAARFPRAVWLAALAPLAVNLPGLAFTGMEHTLHAAASLAILLGVLRVAQGRGIGLMLVAGVFLAPALRLEGLGLALLAAVAVAFLRGVIPAVGLAATALVPVAGFIAFLTARGIGPLPSSVMAKTGDGGMADASLADRLMATFSNNMETVPGIMLGLMTLFALLAGLRADDRTSSTIALVAGLAGVAHLFLGQVGWLNRYEGYVALTLAGALLATAPFQTALRPLMVWGSGAVLAVMGAAYTMDFARVGFWAPRGIYLQHAQMARFIRDYYPHDVAANDVGRIAWQNPNHVLDIWGLASDTARKARLAGQGAWASDLVRADGAGLAMIYADHLDGAFEGWTKLGDLQLKYPRGFLGGDAMQFYATRAETVAPLRSALAQFAPTLPEGVRFFEAPEVGS